MAASPQPVTFEVRPPGGPPLSGERLGDPEANKLVLCHGLTAVRSYVLHGSKLLVRRGFELISYDARGHGQSGAAPPGAGYSYEELAADLAAVITEVAEPGRTLVAGHSMGAHTAAALALTRPELVAGLVLICPAYDGEPPTEAALASWDELAAALEEGGPEAFADAAVHKDSTDPDLLRRLALGRIKLHRDPAAVADALRRVPPSRPFGGLDELGRLDLPVLVVASLDDIDPGHPYAVARDWAEAIPGAELISEEPGSSPLAWQGGRLSREIAAWAEQAGLLGG